MAANRKEKLIALDCDGVLLNYNEAFGRVWYALYGELLPIKNPNAYHAENYYGVTLFGAKRQEFYDFFNRSAWGTMNALPQAIEATQQLRKAGYKIFVVTSIPKAAQEVRHNNLINLGFAVDATIATGAHIKGVNPKKAYIDILTPDYFVDDLMDNFNNLDSDTELVLIDAKNYDSPNKNFSQPILLHSTHSSLWDFVTQHIKQPLL